MSRRRQTHSGNRGAAATGNVAPKTVDEYLAEVPEPARGSLNKVRAVIRSAAPPEATEGISRRMPMFKYKGLLVGFAAFRNHCSLFPMSSSLVEAFKKDLKNFSTSKGTMRFPVDEPLGASLVKKLVKARVAQNERRKQR
ncbi:MAG: DUF1801 domain-containing protein [Acidobacteria bacterium]|nr:DUF1801 domain-containing protein [Acidobacteriota bacterium]